MNRNVARNEAGRLQRKLVKVQLTRDGIVTGFRGTLRAGQILSGLTEVHAEELVKAGSAVLYETKVVHPEVKQGAADVSVVNEAPAPPPSGALTSSDMEVLRNLSNANEQKIAAIFAVPERETKRSRGKKRRRQNRS